MSLEELLAKVYEAKAGRQESDIGMTDPYWKLLNEFRVARAKEENREVDSIKAKEIAGKIQLEPLPPKPSTLEIVTDIEEPKPVRSLEEQLADIEALGKGNN